MKAPPSLTEMQSLFHRLLRAPEGVQAGLDAMVARGELELPSVAGMIRGDDRLDATARLDIYASMYFYRLRDILAEEFEGTAARIGEVHFHNLVTDYLLDHPPAAYSLREAGAALPDFIENHALAQHYPALGDVARIERARIEVFDGPDQDVLDRDRFLAATADDPEGFRLQLAAATRLLEIDARAAIWLDDPHAEVSDDRRGTISLLVFRKGHRVYHRECVEDEARGLEAMIDAPLTLPALAECLLEQDASAEEASERFAALLELWTEGEVLVFDAPSSAARYVSPP